MTKSFPKGFLWGAAASAPQTEGGANLGGKSPSTWDVWFEKEPERFFNQVGLAIHLMFIIAMQKMLVI